MRRIRRPLPNDSGVRTPWNRRLFGALKRRTRLAWRRLRGRPLRPSPAEAALAWLARRSTEQGVRTNPKQDELSSELTRLCLPTVTALGQKQLAASWQAWLAEQPPDEPWPDVDRGQPTPEGLARHAVRAYELGDRAEGDWAMRQLVGMQRSTGGFGMHMRALGAGWLRQPESVAAVKYFLDAAVLQVRATFRAHGAALPATIAADDGRMAAVREWLRPFAAAGLLVADVGCGSGRFLRQLQADFPTVAYAGLDPSEELLGQLPPGMARLVGGLLDIPVADGQFDGVLAVESLEHSLIPATAVAELCRVTRPGGRILIIDKHAKKQPLSECEPWERWFKPDEVSQWLAACCDDVQVAPLAHGQATRPTGLFLCWTARKRG